MLCRATVAFSLLFISGSLAQSPPATSALPSTAESAGSMDPPMPGDHWTYELHDEITGRLKATSTFTITDVTPTEIGVRVENRGNPNYGYYIFDQSWNVKKNPNSRFSPNDGGGIKLPLSPGSTWKFQNDQISLLNNAVAFHRSGSSKIVRQESVTTSAGTFDAYKIEISTEYHNINGATKKGSSKTTNWYAPSVDHWVKQEFVSYVDGHLAQNLSIELVDYGRR
jgi:hypothetical protein